MNFPAIFSDYLDGSRRETFCTYSRWIMYFTLFRKLISQSVAGFVVKAP